MNSACNSKNLMALFELGLKVKPVSFHFLYAKNHNRATLGFGLVFIDFKGKHYTGVILHPETEIPLCCDGPPQR